jgi:hypothetical protein
MCFILAQFIHFYYNAAMKEQGEQNFEPTPLIYKKPDFWNRSISRRGFLGKVGEGAVLVAGLGAVSKEVEDGIFGEQNEVWRKAGKENDEFLDENSETLSHITFGTSFSPEMFGLSYEMMLSDPDSFGHRQDYALSALGVIIDDFNIKHIRLGIRWNNAVVDKQPDLAFYDPYIQKCLEKGVAITLNTGAIKTFRWPEEHVPNKVLDAISIPHLGSIINPSGELAKHAISYSEKLFGKLNQEYGDSAFEKVQPENEGFNAFGNKKWVMSKDYYKDLIHLSHQYFPQAKILLNSSAANDLDKIREVFDEVLEENPDLYDKRVAGIDFYYLRPNSIRLPGVFPAVDPLTSDKLRHVFSEGGFSAHKKLAPYYGITTEITEGQNERYNEITLPQESSQGSRFWILRMAPHTDGMEYIWGSEVFAHRALTGTLTNENKKVIELVQKIQSRQF